MNRRQVKKKSDKNSDFLATSIKLHTRLSRFFIVGLPGAGTWYLVPAGTYSGLEHHGISLVDMFKNVFIFFFFVSLRLDSKVHHQKIMHYATIPLSPSLKATNLNQRYTLFVVRKPFIHHISTITSRNND